MRFVKAKGNIYDLNKNDHIMVKDGRVIEIRTTLSGLDYEHDLGMVESEGDDAIALFNESINSLKNEFNGLLDQLKKDIKRGLL